MSYPCENCELDCKYREWRFKHPESESEEIATANHYRALLSKNPQCPADDERYNVLMEKCKERASYDQNMDTCIKCKNRLKIITVGDIKHVPEACPMLDPMKDIFKGINKWADQMQKATRSLSSITKPMLPIRLKIPQNTNEQLITRIIDLEKLLESYAEEIIILRKKLKESESKSDDDPYYIR